MTPVLVEVPGAVTTVLNPAALAAATGRSTPVEGFDARDAAPAEGTTSADPASATTAARMLPATTRFGVGFLTHTLFSKKGAPKPDWAGTIPFGSRLASVRKIAEMQAFDAAAKGGFVLVR